jgi:hypothetical protein
MVILVLCSLVDLNKHYKYYIMSEPSSFCTICTINCANELAGLLLSLSLFHPESTIYISCDTDTRNIINILTPRPLINMVWIENLNEYGCKTRAQMVHEGIWSDFQMAKARVIEHALQTEEDTLFLDSDIILFNPIKCIDKGRDIGVSPQFIPEKSLRETGYYNGGVLWTKNINVPKDWIKYTKRSRYYDQASIEDLVKKYTHFKFGEEYNIQAWRWVLNGAEATIRAFEGTCKKDGIVYKGKPCGFIHTHFGDKRFEGFNVHVLRLLSELKMYKLLLIIHRTTYGAWVLKEAFESNHDIVEAIKLSDKTYGHEIVFKSGSIDSNYMEIDGTGVIFHNDEKMEGGFMDRTTLILMSHVYIGDYMRSKHYMRGVGVKQITIPPAHSKALSVLNPAFDSKKGIITFVNEGDVEKNKWDGIVKVMLYPEQMGEYYGIINRSKYVLCYKRCSVVIDALGLGSVPILYGDISDRFAPEIVENTHYIRASNVYEAKVKIDAISDVKYRDMQMAGRKWYKDNIEKDGYWNRIMKVLLF